MLQEKIEDMLVKEHGKVRWEHMVDRPSESTPRLAFTYSNDMKSNRRQNERCAQQCWRLVLEMLEAYILTQVTITRAVKSVNPA